MVNQGTAYYGRFHRDGDRGMEKRNPAPKPDQPVLAKWSRDLLGFVVTGRRP
ncbi:hypothetical protein G5V59_26960 [Nocardioides sp. W3-2-3]|uniref:hypothetical protein n=1 Tax=Nocardioides convexus TaxID=2712224 RepID=UPI00241880D1|nr:hypothetical protein [Nocardioides convexus]NHA02033.1 hypothetical protein [Nocardioides convexus]